MKKQTIFQKIDTMKFMLENAKATQGCVVFYPDNLKDQTLALHKESGLSLNKFSELIKISQRTLRTWRIYLGVEKVETNYPNEHRLKEPETHIVKKSITLSSKETRESVLAKKRIRNKNASKKIEVSTNTQEKIVVTKDSEPGDELAEDIKVYMNRSLNAAIPIVNTKGDHVPQKFRDAQEEWLKNNKPKRYSPGGNLIID